MSADSPACNPASTTLSAEQLHLHALEAHRVGNRGRLALAQALRIFQDSRDFFDLGFPSVAAYADKTFGFRRSETYALIKVARALDGLPRCLEAFVAGEICWSALRAIAEVATADTEEQWLRLAAEGTAEQLRREARDARNRGRDRPRQRGYGLPALGRRVVLQMTASQYEKFRKVMQLYGEQVAEKSGGQEVGFEDAMLLLCEQVLAARAGRADAPDVSDAASYALVYQVCPECRRAGVHTPEGLVEVDESEVQRVEGAATIEATIDGARPGPQPVSNGPTPSALRRKVLLRDGTICSNPHCSNPADHAHHVVFRSEGGATAAFNLLAVCGTCHGLIHAGLLEVRGQHGEVEWRRPADEIGRNLRRAPHLAADALPVFRIESTAVDSRPHASALVSRSIPVRQAHVNPEVGTVVEGDDVLDQPHLEHRAGTEFPFPAEGDLVG
ncbi:MAG TPA: HNH endonuclease, partial [Acidobacteria bacterium]|nr:HNH endonuclease [Acidobacteriota bacterium]